MLPHGADRIVIGSDYNFDVGYERPANFVVRIPGLSMRGRSLILRENAVRLLKL